MTATAYATRTLSLGADGRASADVTAAQILPMTAMAADMHAGAPRLLVARGANTGVPGAITLFDQDLVMLGRWPLPRDVIVRAMHRTGDRYLLAGGLHGPDGPRVWLHAIDAATGEDRWSAARTLHAGEANALDVDEQGRIALGGSVRDDAGLSQPAFSLLTEEGTPLWSPPSSPPPVTYEPEVPPRSIVDLAFQADGSVLLDLGRVIVRHCP